MMLYLVIYVAVILYIGVHIIHTTGWGCIGINALLVYYKIITK